jgi:hypothetical protein
MSAHHPGSLPRIVRLLLATAIASIALATGPLHVAAECDGPVPSFRKALATAKRVVIGDVIAVRDGGLVESASSDGWSSRFTLRVRYTPVGEAPTTMQVSDLLIQPCVGEVLARKGDRIALALDATDFTPPMQVNTVAWIRGTPLYFDGVETITTNEVFRLLDLAAPDTSTLAEQRPQEFPLDLLIAVVAGLIAGALTWRRSRPAVHA